MQFASRYRLLPKKRPLLLVLWLFALVFHADFCAAEKVTIQRIAELAPEEQKQWLSYVMVSEAWREKIGKAFSAELAQNQVDQPSLAQDGSDFRLPEKKDPGWYTSDEARRIAGILISYQNPAGGWSKHVSLIDGPRNAGVHWSSQGKVDRPRYVGTFDNSSTTNQMLFLANVYQHTQMDECKQAFEKGLRFILDSQYPNGGWPQVYPLEGGYHDDITFNDDAMIHVLEVLKRVSNQQDTIELVSQELRIQASQAFARGVECILKTQQQQGTEKTLWCAQHDAITLAPSKARAMEPASLSGSESVGILRFLMSLDDPSSEIVDSIESGLGWFSKNRIVGLRKTEEDGVDAFIKDPQSQEVYWARFYQLNTNEPIFPGRDGVIYSNYWDMARKNKVGYDYLTKRPEGLLSNTQKNWRKRTGLTPK